MRFSLFAAPVVGAIGLAAIASLRADLAPALLDRPSAKPNAPPALPHVALFTSGVGYFQREGEIDGTTRVDMTFPVADVNDLIKSMVLQDTGGGKVTAINYDSRDPIERTLKTFAVDLTANPSLGDLLNQARGEKVEVTLQQSAGGTGGTLTGAILGMESQRQPQGKDDAVEVDTLNLVCANGVRGVKLAGVLQVRFLNPALDADLRRALDVIARGRDHDKKTVSLNFQGVGKRTVKVGYVVESPLWKTTYRLVLQQDGKATLQGWALVENTTDDDWTNVRMSLVSGRPISYQMDLYPPLFVPRPTVEPERFASLRPPTYAGPMTSAAQATGFGGGIGGGIAGGGALGALGGLGFAGGNNPSNMGNQGGVPFNRFQAASQLGFQGGETFGNARLSFEQLQERRQGKDRVKKEGAILNPAESVASVASAEDIGDVCHYVIDEKVTLPRQKSTMLPIVTQSAEVAKVSIFNEAVHAQFPLLGVRFKNTAVQPLMQGPITVYDGAAYAGDSRIHDLQPGEDRLLSYALDTGVEAKVLVPDHWPQLASVKAVAGVLHAVQKQAKSKTYLVKNRSPRERVLLIEHRYNDAWDLVAPERAAEKTREHYRFEVRLKAGESPRFEVVEENRRLEYVHLSQADETTIDVYIRSGVASAKLKETLSQLKTLRTRLLAAQREAGRAHEMLNSIADDQTRIRANLEKMPPTSAAYKRYLEKFDLQESEIEKLQADIKAKQSGVNALTKEYEDFVAGVNVEA
jgi:hypothetical protein